MKNYYVYMLSNKRNAVLYIGVTNDLKRRVFEHKEKLIEGFSKKYNCDRLVWYVSTNCVEAAITHEKRIKKWKRTYKENVIKEMNPEWKDLYHEI